MPIEDDIQQLPVIIRKVRAFDAIAEILFPADDPDKEWENDTIEQVADVVRDAMATE